MKCKWYNEKVRQNQIFGLNVSGMETEFFKIFIGLKDSSGWLSNSPTICTMGPTNWILIFLCTPAIHYKSRDTFIIVETVVFF